MLRRRQLKKRPHLDVLAAPVVWFQSAEPGAISGEDVGRAQVTPSTVGTVGDVDGGADCLLAQAGLHLLHCGSSLCQDVPELPGAAASATLKAPY